MSQVKGKTTKKTSANYFTSIVSIAMVLFVLGLLGTFLLQSHNITNSLKENVELQLELVEEINETDIFQYTTTLESTPYIKEVNYVSKDDAATMMQEELGEDFIETLGFNPLFSSVKINLHAAYANNDSLIWIQQDLLESGYIKDIIYDGELLEAINENIQKLAMIIIGVSVLLLIISLILMDSTIKLAMYSNRFLVRSMQLVGATRWFITKPFILRGIFNGFVSGVIASLLLIGVVYYIETHFINLSIFEDFTKFLIIIGAVIGLGILISWISTQRAVSKYLRMKLDDLY